MSKYLLTIELLSDLCVSDGGVYNSSLDIDVSYDKYGFPYIPAKRIKGCLRECAAELNDWGCTIDIRKIFGDKGELENAGNIELNNAVLADYEKMRDEAINAGGHMIYHPQNVLNTYSYVRTQTSVDNETGVALDNSLRTMRVVKKGLKFVTTVTLDSKYADQLKMCVDSFTNIGMTRTRGLGEIKAELTEKKEETGEKKTEIPAGANYLSYKIHLAEPMISKSVAGGQEKAKDYIDGSTVMGLLLRRASEEDRELLLNCEPITFSNAYVSVDDQRLTEVPAYIAAIKNESKSYINKLYHHEAPKEGEQINAMKHQYVAWKDGGLYKHSVVVEERYHHRRPDDKSRGRAMAEIGGDSAFYQIASIEEDQEFEGFIIAKEQQIASIAKLLAKPECRIGYGHSAEYGRAEIRIKEVKCVPDTASSIDTDRVLVTLVSPTLVYNDKAMYSTAVDDLIDEICAVLGIAADEVDREKTEKFVNYTFVGGFNSTWGMRKPYAAAFDKGSAVVIYLKAKKSVSIPSMTFLGERASEGYGECKITVPAADGIKQGNIVSEKENKAAEKVLLEEGGLGAVIAKRLFGNYLRQSILHSKSFASQNDSDDQRATVSNMLLMCTECKNISEVEDSVQARFDKNDSEKTNKLQIAQEIIMNVKADSEGVIGEFCEKFKIDNFSADSEKLLMAYLKIYLQELKYKIRVSKEEK